MHLTLLLTLGLTIVILAIAAGVTARARRPRPALFGVGLAGILVGLYLTGLTQLIADGTLAVIDWFQATPWTTLTSWGVGLLVGGVVLALVAVFLPKGPRRTEPRTAPAASVPSGAPRAQVAGPPAQRPVQRKGLDPEDAEIEELLRKRGIM